MTTRTSQKNISIEWQKKQVDELFELGRGRVISKKEIQENQGLYPVYSSQTSNGGEFGKINTFDFDGEYLTWTTDGIYAGSVFYRNGKFNCTNVCGTLKPKTEMNALFFSYILPIYTEKHVVKTANPKLMNNVMARVFVPVPPVHEQKKIAEILSTVDNQIRKTDEIISATEKLKRGLMHDIFSFKDKEDVKYLALGDIGGVSMCKRVFREETSPVGEIPFYKIGTFGKEPDAFISKELFDKYRKKFSFPKIGDVLLSASGTIGRKVKYDGKPAYFQDSNIIWLDHDESKILNDFLFYLYETITWQTEGSTIKRLYNSILLKKVVPVPSINKQKQVVEILSTIDEKISINKKLKEKLTLLKKGLMQDLLSGRVRTIQSYETKII